MTEAELTQANMIELDNDDNDDHKMKRKRRPPWKYSCFNEQFEQREKHATDLCYQLMIGQQMVNELNNDLEKGKIKT